MTFGMRSDWLRLTAVICAAALAPGDVRLFAQDQAAAAKATEKLKAPDQLDSLVAPLALYPDPLLAQVLAASTYPLEIVQAARWLKENSKLTGEKLTKAAAKQPWDASIQAMVAFPAALNLLDKNIQWTQELGNAFLDQQTDVMDAIQRMRKKAKDSGKLASSKEQKVEVKTVESKTVIEIQPSNPQVIYVPSYDPVVVYGAPPVYAYPPVVYPSYGAVAATAAISFGVGVAMGAFWGGCCGGGGWGWGCGWGNNNVTINNNFNTRYGYNNINTGNRNNVGNGSWNHNPEHRRSVPYNNRNTAQRFNGGGRDSLGRNQNGLGNQRGPGNRDGIGGNRDGVGGNRNGVGGNRDGVGGNRDGVGGNRDGVGGNRDGVGGNRNGAGSANRQSGAAGGGGDRVGNRSIDRSSGSKSAFGDSGSRSRAEASSNRGFSSSRQSGGGGGGGSRSSGGGGARRSGGGRRR